MCCSVLETPSASQQVNRKDMRQDALGSNKSYDIHIENFDVSYGDKYVYLSYKYYSDFDAAVFYFSCPPVSNDDSQSAPMSRLHPLCLFSAVASRLPSTGVPSHDFYHNFCSTCTVTVITFWNLNRFLFTYLFTCLHPFLFFVVSCLKHFCSRVGDFWQCIWLVGFWANTPKVYS